MATTRRLSAIFAADIRGYSRLMGADEEGTLARLNAHRRELVDPKIREHRGRIVKTTGDGLLAEFASVVDAARCAVEVQRGMVEREPERDEDQRIKFRIGINLGDIIVEGGDIFGDGVNVAARLEALAEPGGLCVSGTVRDHIGDRLPYAFTDGGQQNVKNIARPVSVFALSAAAIADTPLAAVKPPPVFGRARVIATVTILLLLSAGFVGWRFWPSPPTQIGEVKPAPRLSIVVLPFANASGDPSQDYFVDAVTADLTTNLSRVSGSFVISRSTAFGYKGKSVDTKQIGKDLGVRYVLEGSVLRDEHQVLVNAQLIDAESGAYVWTDKFDVDRTNLAQAQHEIIARLAHSLQLSMVEAAARGIEREKPTNPDADDFVMQGWASYYRLNSETNLNEAQQHFEQALKIDPQSVEAKVGLATVLLEFVANVRKHMVDGVIISAAQDLARSEELLLPALERDANNPKVIYTLGRLRRQQNRLADAKILLEKAILLDPNNSSAIHLMGITLIALGDPRAAISFFKTRLHLDPGANSFFANWWLGDAYLLLGEADKAIGFFTKARAANPRFAAGPLFLAAAFGLKGDIDSAKVNLAEALKLRPEPGTLKKLLSTPAYQVGSPKYFELREKTVIAGWRRAGLPEE